MPVRSVKHARACVQKILGLTASDRAASLAVTT